VFAQWVDPYLLEKQPHRLEVCVETRSVLPVADPALACEFDLEQQQEPAAPLTGYAAAQKAP
jgi:hypothetical protein